MKLTAFKTVPKPMELRPASNRRQWMDETSHQYGYRCLPLQIANSNGWEIICPSDFLVTWNGGNNKDDLTTHYTNEEFNFTASSFGHGILTLHTGYLFKTQSDDKIDYEDDDSWDIMEYDLLVTGLPNYFYEFMVPLTGIVETWWNPATFTMNWKLLRPGTFEIKKGQPLGFISLIPHGFPMNIEAEIKEMSEDQEVLQKFNTWRQGRDKTLKGLEHMSLTGQGINGIDPSNPATHWEKKYFRGEDEDGTKVDEHKTKVRMPPFKE